jgi:diguanylate cyclase (GGDEF)-like protein/PAS domain S-box-containing protein
MPEMEDYFFKTVADNMFSAVICFDMDRSVIYSNHSLSKITGYEAKEIEDDFWQFALPEYRTQIYQWIDQAYQGNSNKLHEFKIQDKSGVIKWVGFHCHPIFTNNSKQIGVYTRLIDIENHKRLEISYLESKEQITHALLHAPFPSAILTNYGTIIQYNDAWLELTGFTKDEMPNVDVLDNIFVPLNLKSDKNSTFKERFIEKKGFIEGEFKLQTNQGKTRFWDFSSVPLGHLPDRTQLVLTMAVDITDSKLALEALKESESRLQAIFNSTTETFILLDSDYKIQAFNNKADNYAFSLFNRHMNKGDTIFDFIYEQDRHLLVDQFQQALSGQTVTTEYNMKLPQASIWLEMSYLPVYEDGEITGVCLSTLDITQKKTSQKEIEENRHFIGQIADSSPNILYLIDLESNKFIYLNQSWKTILGFKIEDIYDTEPINFFKSHTHSEDVQKKLNSSSFENIENKSNSIHAEFRFFDNFGNYRWLYTTEVVFKKNSDGKVIQILGTAQDVTKRKELEAKLTREAKFDTLTGLPNRRFFLDELRQNLDHQTQNPSYLFAVLFVDLDRFKRINDSLGHNVGDQLLVAVSKRLRHVVRESDIVARLGGDEFTILVKNLSNTKEIIKITENIQKSISQPYSLDQFNISTTSSIGIAPSNKHYQEPEEILRDADTAMYKAKTSERNSYALFNQAMHTQALRVLEVEAELSKSIKYGQLEIYYQPVVSLVTGKITSCEALVRWNHPKRGLLSPGEFLEIAQETGLIINIDKWVLDVACKQLAIWKTQGYDDLKIAVNLSLKQLKQERLLYWIKKAITKYGIKPSQLQLELTENSLIDNSAQTIETLNRIRQLGVILCIDDFGTGYSSLRYLKNLPVDIVKIDQTFVRDIPESVETSAIIKSIIELSHSLNLKVVAEGVQTEDQLCFLKDTKCDSIQGYLISKPVNVSDFTNFLKGRY